jgi:hypothetical protein
LWEKVARKRRMRGSIRAYKEKFTEGRETPHPYRIFDAIRPLPQGER